MIYTIELTKEANSHLVLWMQSGQKKIIQKIFDLLDELREHPKTGTGKVERLKDNLSGYWSRRITKSERMIYCIEDNKVVVTVISLMGHYGDK